MTMIETVRAFRPARLLVAGLFMAALIPLGANAASLKEIQKRGYMNIATEDNYAPFEFVEGGTPKGFTHDVVAELRKYAKFEVRQDILPWSGLLASVRAGKYDAARSEEHTSELQSLMRISYAVFCLKKKKTKR